MKKCNKCDDIINEYNIHLKYKNTCKFCISKQKKEYEQKKENICKRLFWDHCSNSKKRQHSQPKYNIKELCKWVHSQEIFHELYYAWRESNYNTNLKVSIDRLDNTKGYSFNNIEIVTWQTNKDRAYYDKKTGKFCSQKKQIYQYTLNGNLVGIYHSEAEAERNVKNSNQQNISSVCRGLFISHAGFRWFFSEQKNFKIIRTRINYNRIIYQYDAKTGKQIQKFNNLVETTNKLQISDVKIRAVIRGQFKSTNGFHFSFENKTINDVLILLKSKQKKYNKIGELINAIHLPKINNM